MQNAVEALHAEFPRLTVRRLDYLIWKEYQTGTEKPKQETHDGPTEHNKFQDRTRRRTGKFNALKKFLTAQKNGTVQLTFSEIENIIAGPLCKSAYQYSAYWHPSETHTLPNMIIDAGYTIDNIDLQNQKIALKKGK